MKLGETLNILLRNGRILDPSSERDFCSDLLILDGRIRELAPRISVGAELLREVQVFDVEGKWIMPGMLDMHVHLREPGEEYKETIATGTRAAAAGGFAAVACMPNTKPVNDSAAVTTYILNRAREEGFCFVYPVGAISRGLQGQDLAEFGELRDAGAVAVTDDGRPVMNSLMMRRALEYARAFDLTVISHAEDLSLADGGVMNEGPVSTLLGLRGIPRAAEEVMVARDLLLAEMTRGKIHIAHVSTAGSVRLIREAKARGVPVTAETAPHYFTLTDDALMTFDAVYKVNPPLRRPEDVRAIQEGLADGTLDAIATDHAPHSILEKDTELDLAANGMIGLESAVPLLLDLVRQDILTPLQAAAKTSLSPARILGLPFGAFRVGSPAHVTVIDPDAKFILDCHTFQSKSRNCPFHGRQVQGQVLMTIVDGRMAFSRMSP
ncbi:MAG: dihydroorotase [Syntrophobacteraceae bacterium]|nr:dihydroorotase [Syntrophobacteraceae bacterium]